MTRLRPVAPRALGLSLLVAGACVSGGPPGARQRGDAGVPDGQPWAPFELDGAVADAPLRWDIRVYAGSGARGFEDGAAGQARFNGPSQLALGQRGELYVVDTGNRVIRRVDPDGGVTTLRSRSDGGFQAPRGLAVDPSGGVFVSDRDRCIYHIPVWGEAEWFVGRCREADAGEWGHPCGDIAPNAVGGREHVDLGDIGGMVLDADAGRLYLADSFGVVRFASLRETAVGTLAGNTHAAAWDGECALNYCCGCWTSASFRRPTGLALAPQGELIVSDTENCLVRRIGSPSAGSCQVSTLYGRGCHTAASASVLNTPLGVTAEPDGNVFVSDSGNRRVLHLDFTRSSLEVAESIAPPGFFSSPWGLASDGAGRLFVADHGKNVVFLVTPAARPETPGG